VGKWYDTIPSLPELQKEYDAVAHSTRTTQRELPHDVIDIVSQATRHLQAEERSRKRTHLDEEVDNSSTSLSSEPPKSPAPSMTLPPVVVVSLPDSSSWLVRKLPARTIIYLDSGDAKHLFNASDNETSLD
jgi:hypothetical protein